MLDQNHSFSPFLFPHPAHHLEAAKNDSKLEGLENTKTIELNVKLGYPG